MFWETKKDFTKKYNIDFDKFGSKASESWDGQVEQACSLFNTVFSVMESNQGLVDYLADTLISLGDSVPEEIDGCKITIKNPANDKLLFDVKNLPDDLFVAPGEKAPNRVGFSKYASYINSRSIEKYGRPLVIAMSADLADSTNISNS